MRKPQIPAIVTQDRTLHAPLKAMKESIEMLTGVRGGKIDSLATNATNETIIAKINEIIDRLNA
jgi:hypothetical protein